MALGPENEGTDLPLEHLSKAGQKSRRNISWQIKPARCLIFLRMVSKNAWVWKTFNFWILHTVVIHHPCYRTTTHYDTNVSTVTFLSLKGKESVECTYLLCKLKSYTQILVIKKEMREKNTKAFPRTKIPIHNTTKLKSAIKKKTLAPRKSSEINTVKSTDRHIKIVFCGLRKRCHLEIFVNWYYRTIRNFIQLKSLKKVNQF